MRWYQIVGIVLGVIVLASIGPTVIMYQVHSGREQATTYLQNVWRKPFVIDKSYRDGDESVRFYSEGKQLYLNIHNNGSITINNYPRGRE